ncbi:hypothetical protein DSUL_50319 [Desulfovibrionales bacterium]
MKQKNKRRGRMLYIRSTNSGDGSLAINIIFAVNDPQTKIPLT